jgi:hypothetical protein
VLVLRTDIDSETRPLHIVFATQVSAELSIQELVSIDASKVEDYEDLLRDLDSDFEVLMMSAEDWEGVGCVSTSPITFFEPQACSTPVRTNARAIPVETYERLMDRDLAFEALMKATIDDDDDDETELQIPCTIRTNIPTILLNGEPLLQDDAFEPEYLKPKTARSTKSRSSHKRRRRSLSLTDLIKSHKVTEDDLIADFSLDAEYRQAMEAVGW